MKNVAIIGLGYVGLPLASLCATKGHAVIGFEINALVVDKLTTGECHIKDRMLEDLFAQARKTGRLTVSSNADQLADCQIYLICVPTPIDENQDPDLAPLESAVELISPYLKKGDLVVIESTVFPGTCEQIVAPLLERLSGLDVGEELHLAHCPERVNPGDLFWDTSNIPRVVGATSTAGVKLAAEFYASILGGDIFDVRDVKRSLGPKFSENNGDVKVAQVPLGSVTMMKSIRDAEAVKAMENTVRDVNIAFVNELAKISDVLNLDVVDIIDGMATKPFGKGPFYPGAGVGGHCIAVDPEWLKAASKKAGYMPEMISLARNTNNGMPGYTVSVLQDMLNDCGYPMKNTEIAVLGVTYKRNVADPRESPFFDIKKILEAKGAKLNIYDSWYSAENTVASLAEALATSKAILIVTEHTDIFEELKTMDLSKSNVEVILDGRNCLDEDMVRNWGVLYRGIGRR
jgi:UDP-N-acetyl-D-glucosamine dehydrogenase